MDQQRRQNNDAFNKVQTYLLEQGYQGPDYDQGSPLSLVTGEPIYARFTTNNTTDYIKDLEIVRHNLQYAKLGFHIIPGDGFLSISHPGN